MPTPAACFTSRRNEPGEALRLDHFPQVLTAGQFRSFGATEANGLSGRKRLAASPTCEIVPVRCLRWAIGVGILSMQAHRSRLVSRVMFFVAACVLAFEEWIWNHASALLSRVGRLPPFRRIEGWVRRRTLAEGRSFSTSPNCLIGDDSSIAADSGRDRWHPSGRTAPIRRRRPWPSGRRSRARRLRVIYAFDSGNWPSALRSSSEIKRHGGQDVTERVRLTSLLGVGDVLEDRETGTESSTGAPRGSELDWSGHWSRSLAGSSGSFQTIEPSGVTRDHLSQPVHSARAPRRRNWWSICGASGDAPFAPSHPEDGR